MHFTKYHDNFDISGSTFLVTGGAGFIGSNLVEYLVQFNAKKIRILDNLSTGSIDNIRKFNSYTNVEFIEDDIRSYETCINALDGIEFVSHQAALGSVPRSIKDPLTTNEVNISGFLNILRASQEKGIKRMVYAASSSTYGDSDNLPKVEDVIGAPLSPYAVTKYVNELYAEVFSRIYEFHSVGLRYFNVFGPGQSPNGAYAAVIPLFISAMISQKQPVINGLGDVSRDFTFVSNVVQANIRSLLSLNIDRHFVLNIAYGRRTTLLDLVKEININLGTTIQPIFTDPRKGDIKHSLADISKAKKIIGYDPEISFAQGLQQTVDYFRLMLHN